MRRNAHAAAEVASDIEKCYQRGSFVAETGSRYRELWSLKVVCALQQASDIAPMPVAACLHQTHHVRIEACPCHIDEVPCLCLAIDTQRHLAHVVQNRLACAKNTARTVHVGRYTERARPVIAGAERQHPQHHLRKIPDSRAENAINHLVCGAIATGNRDPAPSVTAGGTRQLAGMFRVFGQRNFVCDADSA